MNLLAALLRLPVIVPLGWALLHFLWQGALVAVLLAAANMLLPTASARLRYGAACLALALMLAALVTTFVALSPRSEPRAGVSGVVDFTLQSTATSPSAAPAISINPPFPWHRWLDSHLTWLVCAWLAGVVILSLRITGGWILAQTLRSRARPADLSWQQTLTRLVVQFGIRRNIELCESTRARVPAVIGWLRPVILLPVSALAGLTPQMIEVILAHELAHIRRHDYLVNLIQTAIETLLFYHPAVWWVGKKIRQERENCCDDLAVAECGDALIYARALTALENIRYSPPRAAMAATAGSLLARIRRLVEVRPPVVNPASTWLTGTVTLLILGAVWAADPISTANHGREMPSFAAVETMQTAQPYASKTRPTASAAQASSPNLQSAAQASQFSPAEMTPGQMFRRATKDGDLETIETLLSIGFNTNGPLDGRGFTPLWYAIECGRADVVDLLLSARADPNAKGMPSHYYATPLELALQLGSIPIASRLIGAGAHVDAKGTDGRTALYYAAREAKLDAIRFLIEMGADVNVRDKEGASPLDDAVRRGSLDTIALLLAHGAHLNEPETQAGATPINEAASRGNIAIVQFLLEFHPDLAIRDKRGYSPLDNALRFGREEAAVLLLEAEPKDPQAFQSFGKLMDAAIRKDELHIIEALLRHGVLANGTLPSGSTPLEAAAFAGATKAVHLLLDKGADPKIGAPLEGASLKGHDSIVGILLDHGAQVNFVNRDSGATALYAAAAFGQSIVVKLLLSRGANPNLCGKNHKSPYQAALDNGYGDVATEIKLHGGGNDCQL